jgi:hypothetical protein
MRLANSLRPGSVESGFNAPKQPPSHRQPVREPQERGIAFSIILASAAPDLASKKNPSTTLPFVDIFLALSFSF